MGVEGKRREPGHHGGGVERVHRRKQSRKNIAGHVQGRRIRKMKLRKPAGVKNSVDKWYYRGN